jgi:hypothetical protein
MWESLSWIAFVAAGNLDEYRQRMDSYTEMFFRETYL